MSDLVDFLRARIDEDEDRARDAAGWDKAGRTRLAGRWNVEGVASVVDELGRTLILSDSHSVPRPVADHVVGWDPARVLAECAAKRRVLDAFEYLAADPELAQHAWTFALQCMVMPYASHPDCQEDWTPWSDDASTPPPETPPAARWPADSSWR